MKARKAKREGRVHKLTTYRTGSGNVVKVNGRETVSVKPAGK